MALIIVQHYSRPLYIFNGPSHSRLNQEPSHSPHPPALRRDLPTVSRASWDIVPSQLLPLPPSSLINSPARYLPFPSSHHHHSLQPLIVSPDLRLHLNNPLMDSVHILQASVCPATPSLGHAHPRSAHPRWVHMVLLFACRGGVFAGSPSAYAWPKTSVRVRSSLVIFFGCMRCGMHSVLPFPRYWYSRPQ